MTEADAVVSPDGRFRWDGQRWVPTRRQRRRTWLLVVAILVAVLGLMLVVLLVVLAPVIVELVKVFS